MGLTLTSPQFDDGAAIPAVFTCEGDDISPPLAWSGVPAAAESLALVIEDPDAPDPAAPQRIWTHWLLYNIPCGATGLPQGANHDTLPPGTREGLNDWKNKGYGGPCPPIGRHRYVHKLYALDTQLGDLGTPTRAQLEQAMRGHVIEQAELIGMYQKK
jgi:Raf kinase inhibitor-like YbhB/YbcL family protein